MSQKQEFLDRFGNFLNGLQRQDQLFGVRVTGFRYIVIAKGFVNSETLELAPSAVVHNESCDDLNKPRIMDTLTNIIEDFEERKGMTDDGDIAVALFVDCMYSTTESKLRSYTASDIPVWKNPDEEFINIALEYNHL